MLTRVVGNHVNNVAMPAAMSLWDFRAVSPRAGKPESHPERRGPGVSSEYHGFRTGDAGCAQSGKPILVITAAGQPREHRPLHRESRRQLRR